VTASRPLALALDLGSTAIKAGVLDEQGCLAQIESLDAPPLYGTGEVRAGDVDAYTDRVRILLSAMSARVPAGTPLGIASQRSTFTLWERETGRSRTPLISWQDRRAADWCDANRGLQPDVIRRTGLPLSAHYVGPKLATLQASDPDLARAMHRDDLLFGTLETRLIWNWSKGRLHETDPTMAARTLMFDLETNDWSPELLSVYGVPRSVLPDLVHTSGRELALESGPRLTTTISDQAAAALATFDDERSCALVNLGTGAFVLLPADQHTSRMPGYLYAPILDDRRYALEGPVNGAGPAVDRFGQGPTALPREDPTHTGFAVPDLSGLGAPHWRPRIGLTLSPAAEGLPAKDRRRIVIEGVLFRVREILDDLCGSNLPDRIILAGGLTREPAVGCGLASLLGRPLELLRERESGLLGAARLAAGLEPYGGSPTETISPGENGAYLPSKFEAWKRWLGSLLAPGPRFG